MTDLNRPSRFSRGCLLAGAPLLANAVIPPRTAAAAQADYDFGVARQFSPWRSASIWRPLPVELGRRRELRFRLVGAPRIPAHEQALVAGDFDFSPMNPPRAMIAMGWGLTVPAVRGGAKLLHGVLVPDMNQRPRGIKLLSAIAMGRAMEATLDDDRTSENWGLEEPMAPIGRHRAGAASDRAKAP